MDAPGGERTHLGWGNVGLGFSFVVFDAVISHVFGLGVGSGLVTAAIRCVIQLAIMALVLQKIFDTHHILAVGGLACLLNLLGTTEVVINKSKRRFDRMFPVVLLAMLCSTIPVSIIGTRFAMAVEPFWTPDQYIPIVGMLCGATISGVVVAVNFVLKEIIENRDKIETLLAFGATRFEACMPLAKEALRLALTPPINQMSVLGIIAIPGMMTGAILGGSSVQQAAKLQMVIMFMIAASTALASMLVTIVALMIVVDGEHRIRDERIDARLHWVYRGRNWLVGKVVNGFKAIGRKLYAPFNRRDKSDNADNANGERDRLLG